MHRPGALWHDKCSYLCAFSSGHRDHGHRPYSGLSRHSRYPRQLDEIIVSLNETRNDVVGLEHAEPEEIREKLIVLEEEAANRGQGS